VFRHLTPTSSRFAAVPDDRLGLSRCESSNVVSETIGAASKFGIDRRCDCLSVARPPPCRIKSRTLHETLVSTPGTSGARPKLGNKMRSVPAAVGEPVYERVVALSRAEETPIASGTSRKPHKGR
jgi:hypothetical protein